MTTILPRLAALIGLFAFAATALSAAAEEQRMTPQRALTLAQDALGKGDSYEALRATYHAMLLLTQQAPFHIRQTKLVTGDPKGYGDYQERDGNVYKPGEKIQVYLEPGAFKFARPENRFDFGFTVDFLLAKPDGDVLGGQQAFGTYKFSSLRPNTEVFLDLTLNLHGLPQGDYRIKLTVHDVVSEQTAEVVFPVTIAGS